MCPCIGSGDHSITGRKKRAKKTATNVQQLLDGLCYLKGSICLAMPLGLRGLWWFRYLLKTQQGDDCI